MTPIPTAQANTTDLVRWNTVHSSARMVIERAFGRLKARFRRLLGTIRQRKRLFISQIIMACVLLHNFFIVNADDFDDAGLVEPDETADGGVQEAAAHTHFNKLQVCMIPMSPATNVTCCSCTAVKFICLSGAKILPPAKY